MREIVTGGTATELWHGLVREGERRAQAALDDEVESYLVFALMRHVGDAPLAHRIMALEFLETLLRDGRAREAALRDVGDRCLLIAGLYPDLARRRRVSLRYFVDLGQGAYDQLGQELRAALADLYAALARQFAKLVRVLLEVRKLSGDWHGLAPIDRHALAAGDAHAAAVEFPGAILVDAGGARH